MNEIPSIITERVDDIPLLLETYADLQHRLPRLTLWIVGGETLPRDLRQRFQELMPYSRLFNSYGTSEVAGNATWYN